MKADPAAPLWPSAPASSYSSPALPGPVDARRRRGGRPMASAALAGAAALWAAYTPVTSVAATSAVVTVPMPVTLLLPIQVAVAAAVLWLAVVLRGHRPPGPVRRLVLLGALEPAANCTLFALALTIVPAAAGSLLLSSESVLVALLGVLVLKERLGRAGWAAVLACLPGLWLLAGADTLVDLSPGALLVFAATAASALYATAAAWPPRTEHVRGMDALTMTTWQFTFGLAWVSLLPLGHLLTSSHTIISAVTHTSAGAWWAAIGGGLLLAAPCLLYNHAIRHVGIARAGVILNLIPVFGAAIAVIWLGDTLSGRHLLGATITLAGITILAARR
ncbi:DMT family transporter [Nonomuraea sp. NPDC023979]|uniref:DMT family transporter n=1 Tax=Nonomuraea sp. NPDC023979 TaxID=3154796 RepID=UPI0033DE3CF2